MSKDPIWSKPRTLKELAAYYEVDKRTLKNWLSCPSLDSIKPEAGRFYSIRQIKIIVTHLGGNEGLFDPDQAYEQKRTK